MRTVEEITFDWFHSQESGEEFSSYLASKGFEMEYHYPQGEGDRHYVDVKLLDGRIHRVFNLHSVVFGEERHG